MTEENERLTLLLDLLSTRNALVRRFDAELASYGLGLTDFVILLRLARSPRIRRVDLAEQVGLSPSGVTRALVPLERLGLVARERDERDARLGPAVLTPLGERSLAEAAKTVRRVADAVLGADWTEDDLTAFASALGRTRSAAEGRTP
ncbi:DNA-binding transcriptional regulator, MarR family [Streptoalloteichus tenebrarius]|uniref:DNA-binding transcriptional regulator, MarR family n=1 Tax=Streptoalloteichus tenebrarius (strain ATCC 17920 / DSM 40477 / JCM 4838 / CBS 697.72 / NBRC 16177 / NCIMB 11028 / NRRL B-12390 / A12253. 1 / ISP 5477) TaxID=1933 RepID=A0ABT1HV82_STRSD|nr:MarR family transcriptional regulator [Streptoalloteichus tenebrarius]MCP2259407.1 DNA-binding transcriptional regulator, MarR family [Streptoalloteichus tenebrarius]BFF02349.1 MarR family transcriptional regulator [Streptoalloteichus tenebrarius]